MVKGKNEIVAVTGRKGCGKTSHAARALRERFKAGRRVLIVSPVGRFADEHNRLPLPARSPILTSCDVTTWENLRGRSAFVYPDDDEVARFAFRFAYALSSPDRPLILVVDEIDMYLSQARPDETLLKCIRYGRHRSLSLWGIAQRPANVHKDLYAQADRLIIYQVKLPSDVDYLERYAGVDPEAVRSLEPFQCLEVDQNKP